MLFNSYQFIFIFFPLTFFVYWISLIRGVKLALIWLVVASLIFYGSWNKRDLVVIVASLSANYVIGRIIVDSKVFVYRRILFMIGIAANLALLAYYKYWDFFAIELKVVGLNWPLVNLALPLGISFFTFTQIAYLSDAYRYLVKDKSFIKYAIFVTYFPHLIAGPLIHHKQIISQFNSNLMHRVNSADFSSGMTLFVIGLAKKIFLADNLSRYVNLVFDVIPPDGLISTSDAWCGALAYALQLYFDFSAYSDMAVGVSRCFGIELPINFNSPYKSRSIIEFWKRWHITLSSFLRDYLYIPLGGRRVNEYRRYVNLGITMLLGGLWHGANWTFIIWGALHALYLISNHFLIERCSYVSQLFSGPILSAVQRMIVFILVVIAWVFFRANDLTSAMIIISAMFGFGEGADLVSNFISTAWIAVGLTIVWTLPNSNQIINKLFTSEITKSGWNLKIVLPMLIGLSFWLCILMLDKKSEFLYFQF